MSDKITHIGQLKPDQRNPRRHNQRNIGVVVDSLQQVGFARSIVIDEDGTILAGNGVTEAAAIAGIEKVVEVEADGETIVAVRRRGLSEEQKTKLKYYDNRSGELADWDPAIIVSDLELGIDLSSLWNPDELSAMLEGAADSLLGGDGVKDAEPQIDKAAELKEKWGTALGQVWQLGEHRIVCGDCTDAAVVEMVMRGERAEMMVTDPPYGVEYNPEWRDEADKKGVLGNKYAIRSRGKVSNDDRADWTPAYELFLGDVSYIWSGDRHLKTVLNNIVDCGFLVINVIAWAKPSFALSQGNYHPQHESCIYATRKGSNHHWGGDRTQSTLWQIAGMNPMGRSQDSLDERTGHGTQKPLECMARPIRNHKSEMIYDPFLGSGTTLIACENLKRKCRGIEIDPGYLAVTIQRWADLTGKDPIRLSE